jgi:PPM family protein phosphatase
MPLVFRYAARSDVGLVRKGNEDSGYASDNLLIVFPLPTARTSSRS